MWLITSRIGPCAVTGAVVARAVISAAVVPTMDSCAVQSIGHFIALICASESHDDHGLVGVGSGHGFAQRIRKGAFVGTAVFTVILLASVRCDCVSVLVAVGSVS